MVKVIVIVGIRLHLTASTYNWQSLCDRYLTVLNES